MVALEFFHRANSFTERLTSWDFQVHSCPQKVRKWTIDFYILMTWRNPSIQVPALNIITIVTSDKTNGTTVSFIK